MLEQDWITNPVTKKLVKIGSQTHRKLINQGILKNTKIDEKVLASYTETDDVLELKKQLKNNLKDNQIINVGRGRYKDKLVVGYKGLKGRPLKQNSNECQLENFINNILRTPISSNESGNESSNESSNESE